MSNTKLIGLIGHKGSGKNTAADFLCAAHKNSCQLAFADALKNEVCAALDITREELETRKSFFRPILQWWGTEWRRGQAPEYWTRDMRYRIAGCQLTKSLVVVTDIRFLNEALFIQELGGTLIRVLRFNNPFDTNDAHSSETDLDSFSTETTIYNDGTLEDLKQSVNLLLL